MDDDRVAAGDEELPSHAAKVAECYRLAALIYLERVARGTLQSTAKVAMLAELAFKSLSQIRALERPWPLFVLALEANGEEQRRILLDVLDGGAEYRGEEGNFSMLRKMVKSAWMQQDLAGGRQLDMLDVYNTVISANHMPPSFV